MNVKRLLLILGFILLVVAIGLAIYFVFFQSVFGPAANENGNVNGGILPVSNRNRNVNAPGNVNALPNANLGGAGSPIAEGGSTRVQPVVETLPGGAVLSSNGRDLIYYDPTTGKFYSQLPDGSRKTALTDDTYQNVDRITWSPQRDRAILEFPDGSKYMYDFQQRRQYTLAPEMEDIRFSPGGDKLAFKFIGDSVDDRFLAISKADGTEGTTVEPLADKANQFEVDWSPAGNVVGTFHETIDANRQRVIPVGQLGENFADFTLPGRGYTGRWSPDGNQLLYSIYSKDTAYTPSLYIADGRTDSFGAGNTNLDLTTWPDKCTFASTSSLICAVPQYLEPGAGLVRDTTSTVPDDFYQVDLSTGVKKLLAHPVDASGSSGYTASDLFVSTDGSILYFFDRQSKQVQKIQLR